MSEEVTRRCDFRIHSRGKYHKCDVRIPDDEPTEFTVDDNVYLGDLCEQHRLDLNSALAPFIEVSKASLRQQVGKALRNAFAHYDGTKFTTADARQWLVENGYEVGQKGSIREDLIEDYKAAYQEANN